jgi:hypothetical protein
VHLAQLLNGSRVDLVDLSSIPLQTSIMNEAPDSAILRARELFTKSGLTLDDLGQRMGYGGDVARKSAWQFLNRTADPRLSMLRRFAQAVGVPIAELFTKEKRRGRSK